ncbi:MAG TPA: RNA polymerase sigma factor [Solirubrobacteraceae bacterium]
MEASAIPASVGLGRTRIAIGASLLRIRSDDQLVTLFREGNDEAFRVIHDRYRARMLAYARQMLSSSGRDPEDAVQDIFLRAYHGLRTSDRQLALRAWLYRIAHNRCIDDLRRAQPLAFEAIQPPVGGLQDPVAKVEQRDALRRLISDVQQLPGQQRSALLMRELSGMSYSDVSGALGVTVPAVKSLLVRARVGLAQASEARDTACSEIRADLILAHDRGVRSSGLARRHLRECPSCREFRTEVRGVSRQLAALAPTLGPLGVIANLLGLGGGGGGVATGGGAAATGGSIVTAGGSIAATGGSAATAGAAGSAGLLAGGASHVVTLLAAAVVTAGGAVEIQTSLSQTVSHASRRHHLLARPGPAPARASHAAVPLDGGVPIAPAGGGEAAGAPGAAQSAALGPAQTTASGATGTGALQRWVPITMLLDPDVYASQNLVAPPLAPASNPPGTSLPGTTTAPGPVATPTPGTATGTGSGSGQPSASGGTGPASGSATAPATSNPPAAAGAGSSSTASAPSSSTGATSTPTGSGTATGSSTPAPSTGSASTSGASSSTSGTSPGATSVGRSTTSAGSSGLVSFVAHRRPRHHHLLVGLSAP